MLIDMNIALCTVDWRKGMKIRTRLAIAFLVIILVPIVLCSIAGIGLSQYQMKIIEEYYGIDELGYETISDSTLFLNKVTQKLYGEIIKIAEENAEKFEDMEFLDSLNTQLKSKYSFLVVRENDEVIYNGGNQYHVDVINLPPFGINGSTNSNRIFIDGENKYLIKQIDYWTADEEKGTIFIISTVGQFLPEAQRLAREVVIAALLILGITGVLLIGWIYQSIVKPLRQLQEATHNIKEGNLDFTIENEGRDEIAGLCRDFEDMRRRLKDNAEEKIQYDKENKELISNISHDLKTPITAIKGYAEGIMDGVADTPVKMDKYIRTIYNKANDMSRLIDELTFYSKMDTNRIPYTFNKIHIDQYFRDCVEEMTLELEEKNIELTFFNYLDKDVVIIADAEQLKKVINNIIGNSVKYMDKKKGIINIRIKDAGDFVQVEIEDNGKGIAVKDLPYIFDRFYRTDVSRNSQQGGSGIGLSIVKKIIEDHGGRIWATSKEATGTVMCFVFRKYQEDYSYEVI